MEVQEQWTRGVICEIKKIHVFFNWRDILSWKTISLQEWTPAGNVVFSGELRIQQKHNIS